MLAPTLLVKLVLLVLLEWARGELGCAWKDMSASDSSFWPSMRYLAVMVNTMRELGVDLLRGISNLRWVVSLRRSKGMTWVRSNF